MREQPDFSTSPRPRRPPARDLLAIVLGLLALGLALRTAWSARQEADQARERLAEARREVDVLQERLRAVSVGEGAGGALLARAAAAEDVPPEKVVSVLAELLPDDVRVHRLTIAYEDAVDLDLQLVARTPAAWDLALDRLAGAATLQQVTPGPERRDGEIRTSVHAQWRSGGR